MCGVHLHKHHAVSQQPTITGVYPKRAPSFCLHLQPVTCNLRPSDLPTNPPTHRPAEQTSRQQQQATTPTTAATAATAATGVYSKHVHSFRLRYLSRWTSAGSPSQKLASGASSDDCARGGDTSSSQSLRSWPRSLTTQPYGDRRRPGPGEGVNETHHTWRNLPALSLCDGGGRPVWLYYSKRIIIVRWADLSDFFFRSFSSVKCVFLFHVQ